MSLSSVMAVLMGTAMRQRPLLFNPHPLQGRPLAFRVQYMRYVGLCVSVERSPSVLEERAFIALATHLGLTEDQAKAQLQARASLTEDEVFNAVLVLDQEDAQWVCLLDVIWIQTVQSTFVEADRLACQAFGILLGVSVGVQEQLYELLQLVRLKDRVAASRVMRNISAKASAVQYLQQIVDLIPSNMSILPSADWRAAHKVYTSNNFRTESSGALVHFDLSPNGALLLLTFEYRIVMLNVATGKEIRQIKYCRDEDYSNFLKKENTYGIKTPLAAAYFSLDGRWMISITSESDKYKSIAVIFDLMAGNPDTYIETFSNDTTLSLTDIEKQTNIEFCHKGNVSIFDEDKREERVLSYPKYRTATSRVGQDAIVKTLVELIDKTAFADASGMMASDKHWLAIETNPKTIQIRSVSEVRGAIIASDAIVGYGFTIDSSGLFVADSAGHITLWHAGSDLPQSPLQ